MKNEFMQVIQELDDTLRFLRANLIAAPATEKSKWMDKINNLLDQRLVWMNRRDCKS